MRISVGYRPGTSYRFWSNSSSYCQTLVIPAYPKSYGVHIDYSVSPQNNHYVESPMCYMLWHDFCVFIRLSHKYVLNVTHMFGIVTNTVGNHTNRIGNHTNVFGIISIEWGISDGLSKYNHRKFGIQINTQNYNGVCCGLVAKVAS